MIRIKKDVTVVSSSGQQNGTCTYEVYGISDGIKLAGVWLGLIWLLTFPTALIPILRWITLPIGFAGGLILAVKTFRRRIHRRSIVAGEAFCPKCSREVKFAFDDATKHLDGVCPKCACCYEVSLSNMPRVGVCS